MRKKWRRLIAFIWGYTPVTRKRMKRAMADVGRLREQQRQDLLHRHEKELKKATRHANEIVKRLYCIEFDRDMHGRYSVVIQFDAQMMGMAPQDELRFIAQLVGEQVETEIATSKFIVAAADAERYRRNVRNKTSTFTRNSS